MRVAGQGWSSLWIADVLEKRPGYERLHEIIGYATNPGLFSALYMARSESIASTPPTAMR